jgi:hypothetical protein
VVIPRLAGLMLLLVASDLAFAATFTASVDRKELYVNEYVVLTLELHDSDTRLRAQGVDPNVDLSILSGSFDVGVPRADFRFNIERNYGRSTSTIRVELFPKRPGRARIPSFAVDGLRTAPIELRVLPLAPDANPEVFARSGVAKRHLFVREQTLLFLDLYHRVNLKTASLGGQLESRPREVEAHALPAAERTERVNGIEYEVTRTAWAISPLTDQPLTFYLPDIWIETEQGKRWRLPVREETLAVRPLPAHAPPDALVGRPQIEQKLADDATVSDLIPWEVRIATTSALNTLPASLPVPQVRGMKVYLDRTERRVEPMEGDRGVRSVGIYKGYLMPTMAGLVVTPSISLAYVDTGTGEPSIAGLSGRTLRVAPAEAGTTTSRAATGEFPRPTTGPATERHWRLVALILGAAWFAVLGRWLFKRIGLLRSRTRIGSAKASGSLSHKDRLLAAFGSRTLEGGLRAWERDHGPDPALRAEVREVQRACYRSDTRVNDQALAATIDKIIARLTEKGSPKTRVEDPWSPRAFRGIGRATATQRCGGENA